MIAARAVEKLYPNELAVAVKVHDDTAGHLDLTYGCPGTSVEEDVVLRSVREGSHDVERLDLDRDVARYRRDLFVTVNHVRTR